MDTKVCAKCGQEKIISDNLENSEFPWRKTRNCFSSFCRKCHNEYNQEYYKKNKPHHLLKVREGAIRSRERIYTWLFEYFKNHFCIDCGETDPIVLEFDHRDGTNKKAEVSVLVKRGNFLQVKEEVSKCDVRCANCHKKRTAVQNTWFWLRFLKPRRAASGVIG